MQKMARKSSTVLPRMYSIALNSLVIFLMISRAASASQICDVVGQKYGTAIQELLDKVFTYDRLNLIILLDVSASIGYELYRLEIRDAVLSMSTSVHWVAIYLAGFILSPSKCMLNAPWPSMLLTLYVACLNDLQCLPKSTNISK